MSATQETRALGYAAGAVLLWSTVATAFKLTLRSMDPLQLLLCANVVSILTLGAVLLIQRRLAVLRGYTGRDLGRCAMLGLLNPFLYYIVLFEAYDRLPAQQAQPLNYTWAITLALLSVPLLKQRLGGRELLAILVSYGGAVVIATRGELLALRFSDPVGVALALGSTVIWALYWIYNTRDRNDPVASLFLGFLFALPFTLAACASFSSLRIETPAALLGAAYTGVFEMGITYVLWLKALKLTSSAARIGSLIFFSPFLSLVFIHFLVGEEILGSTIVGLALIVAGSLLQRSARRAGRRLGKGDGGI